LPGLEPIPWAPIANASAHVLPRLGFHPVTND